MPAPHGTHSGPSTPACRAVPAAHREHGASAATASSPSPQLAHCVAPGTGATMPAPHGTHSGPTPACRAVPAAHGEHGASAATASSPSPQLAHCVAPGTGATVPAPHATHPGPSTPACRAVPAAHGEHGASAATASSPSPQLAHCVAPGTGATVPAPHGTHSGPSTLACRAVPAAHNTHGSVGDSTSSPSSHKVHCDAPGCGATDPGPHATHSGPSTAANRAVPGAHGTHGSTGDRTSSPSPHAVQLKAAGAGATVPGPHGWHAVTTGGAMRLLNNPCAQSAHTSATSSNRVPLSQWPIVTFRRTGGMSGAAANENSSTTALPEYAATTSGSNTATPCDVNARVAPVSVAVPAATATVTLVTESDNTALSNASSSVTAMAGMASPGDTAVDPVAATASALVGVASPHPYTAQLASPSHVAPAVHRANGGDTAGRVPDQNKLAPPPVVAVLARNPAPSALWRTAMDGESTIKPPAPDVWAVLPTTDTLSNEACSTRSAANPPPLSATLSATMVAATATLWGSSSNKPPPVTTAVLFRTVQSVITTFARSPNCAPPPYAAEFQHSVVSSNVASAAVTASAPPDANGTPPTLLWHSVELDMATERPETKAAPPAAAPAWSPVAVLWLSVHPVNVVGENSANRAPPDAPAVLWRSATPSSVTVLAVANRAPPSLVAVLFSSVESNAVNVAESTYTAPPCTAVLLRNVTDTSCTALRTTCSAPPTASCTVTS